MVIYYVTMAALLGFGWLACVYRPSKRNLILFLTFAGIILVAIATMRYSIGYDYFNYKRIYEELGGMTFQEILSSRVYIKFIGYAFLNKLVAMTGSGYHVLLFLLNVAMTSAVLWMVYRHSTMPWVSLFIYITLQFFAHSMNLLRQSIAATICLMAYTFIRDKKLLPFLLVVAVACTFHLSALFMLPVYFVLNWRASAGHYLAVGIPAVFIYLYSTPIARLLTHYIFKSYAGYIDSRYWAPLKWSYAVFPAVYFIVVLFFAKKLLEANPKNKVLINSAFYSFLLYFFSTHHMILERFSIYVFLYSLFLIPAVLDTFRVDSLPLTDIAYYRAHSPKERKLLREGIYSQSLIKNVAIAVALGGCLCYFFFAAAQGSNGYHKMYPYVSLLQQDEGQIE